MAASEAPPPPPERHRAMFRISDVMLAKFLAEGEHHYQVDGGVPPDAKILGTKYEFDTSAWLVAVEHESLPLCRENQVMQELHPVITYTGGPLPAGGYQLRGGH